MVIHVYLAVLIIRLIEFQHEVCFAQLNINTELDSIQFNSTIDYNEPIVK